ATPCRRPAFRGPSRRGARHCYGCVPRPDGPGGKGGLGLAPVGAWGEPPRSTGGDVSKAPVNRRRGWHILEAPPDRAVERANRRRRSTEPRQRAWHILEAPTG